MLKTFLVTSLLYFCCFNLPLAHAQNGAQNTIKVRVAEVRQQELVDEIRLTGTVTPHKISLFT